MMLRTSAWLYVLALGSVAAAASLVGCSSSVEAPAPAPGADAAGTQPSDDAAATHDGNGTNPETSHGVDAPGEGSVSSGDGGGGGDTGGLDAGIAADTGGADGPSAQDAGSVAADAGTSTDTGSGADLCANASAWLTPMNQARAALGVGEPPLTCDPIAAQVALNYANKCNYMHNANRNTDYAALGGRGPGVGENLAAGTPTESVAQAVASWLSEASSYTYATNTCASGAQCGHYTQIIWKTTTAVGCAHVACTTGSPFNSSMKWDFSVCDYSPPGNYVNMKPY